MRSLEKAVFLTNSKNFFRPIFSCYTHLQKLQSMTNSVFLSCFAKLNFFWGGEGEVVLLWFANNDE